MTRISFSRLAAVALCLILVASITGGVLAYRHYRVDAGENLYTRGLAALKRQDFLEVQAMARLLRQKGNVDRSRLLEGQLSLQKAHQARHNAPRTPSHTLAEQIGQMVLAGPVADPYPIGLKLAAWLTGSLVQTFPPPSQAGDAQLREALITFARIHDDGETGAEATRLAAQCLRELDSLRWAATGLQALLDARPTDRAARRLLSEIYIDTIDATDALPSLEAWSDLEPNNGVPWRWRGWFLKEDKPDEAAEAYRHALKSDLPEGVRPDAALERARLLADNFELAQAMLALDDCPVEARTRLEWRILHGRCLLGLEQADQAAALLDGVLHDHPGDTEAMAFRAKIYLDNGELAKARALLQQAIAIQPHDERAHSFLADAYASVHDKVNADLHRRLADEGRRLRDHLRAVCAHARQQPWDDAIRYQAAVLCVQWGDSRACRLWLHAALACNPAHFAARQLLARLEQ